MNFYALLMYLPKQRSAIRHSPEVTSIIWSFKQAKSAIRKKETVSLLANIYIATQDWYIFPVPSLIYPFLMVFWRLGTFCLCFKGRFLIFWISPRELGNQFVFGLIKPDPRMALNIWAYCQIQNGTIYPFLIVLGDARKIWHFFERKNVFFHWFSPSYREPRKIFALGLIKTDPRMALNIWAHCQMQNGKIYPFIIVLGV